MANTVDTDKYAYGVWKNQHIKFNRTYKGHRFTDEECERLLNGEIICVRDLVNSYGRMSGSRGKLSRQYYNGYEYVGFEHLDYCVPLESRGHRFTEDEIARLEAGEVVQIDDFISKAGNPYPAPCAWGQNERGYMDVRLLLPERKN